MTRLTLDTSVLVAALATWHPEHASSRRALVAADALPSHVLAETYSVLTRLPSPHRIAAAVAGEAISALDLEVLALSAAGVGRVVATLAAAGIGGGAVYDGLVAATAREHLCVLVTLDRRATRTYDLLGVTSRQPA